MDRNQKDTNRDLLAARNAGRRVGRSINDAGGPTLLIIGACLLFFSLILANSAHGDAFPPIVGGAICFGIGVGKIANARRLPKVQIMRLAESRDGLLTLSEITTALDIDPDLALRTLKTLAKSGIAHQRWEEVHKNLWEFPDYTKRPALDPPPRPSTPERPTTLPHPASPDPTSATPTPANPVLQHQ